MNIVVVPLIGSDESNWFASCSRSPSFVDNFCRLFLPPPDSELRKAMAEAPGGAVNAVVGGDAPNIKGGREPNGFLVVDAGGELCRRISRYIIRNVLPVTSAQESSRLELWARILGSRRPIATVWRVDHVTIEGEDGSGPSGAETAQALVKALNRNCDAVVAFEPDVNSFGLRPAAGTATAVTELYPSCDLNDRQEKLRATWHWDRDAEQHCEWLGINPPHLAVRNDKIIGAALMFESRIIIADRYIGKSLCDVLLSETSWNDEYDAYQRKWGPTWLESLCFLLSAWKKSASACGNTQPRTCIVKTAARLDEWKDVLWFFVALAERSLSQCLGGEVQFDILAEPEIRRARDELHPRYIFASTRAIQSDRGFDLVDKRYKHKLTFRYAEIASRTGHDARHSHNSWAGDESMRIPRHNLPDSELVWMPTMTTRSPRRASNRPGKQAGGPQAG